MSFQWTPSYWQGWRESNNPYRQFKSNRDRSPTVQALELQDGERVLEVGCGYGWITEALHCAAHIDWVGLDQSPSMVQRLRAAFPDLASKALIGDARHLPLASASFDKVLCTGVLMHIDGAQNALREFRRVLVPGGRLVCSINNALSPFSIPVRVRNSFKNGFVQNFSSPGTFRTSSTRFGIRGWCHVWRRVSDFRPPPGWPGFVSAPLLVSSSPPLGRMDRRAGSLACL